MRISNNVFVISDWHFGHKSVIEFANRPGNHEEIIIERCNEVVKKHDTLLFLGDLTFVNKEKTRFFTDRIKCKNKYMIFGNHDNRTDKFYRDCGFKPLPQIYTELRNKYGHIFKTLITHKPVVDLPFGYLNVHGHIHRGTHREYSLSQAHINVSCEPLEFYPVQLGTIINGLINLDNLIYAKIKVSDAK